MPNHELRLDFSGIDFGCLQSEEDLQREAERLLPTALSKLGEAAGEFAWKQMQDSFRAIPEMKLNSSSSDKRQFIREAGENYRKQADPTTRSTVISQIVEMLRPLAQISEGEPLPTKFDETERKVLRLLKHVYLTDGGRPLVLSGPGGIDKQRIMEDCSLDESQYREVMGRLEHFRIAQTMGRGASNEWVAINDGVIEAVRSLESGSLTETPSVVNNISIGTMVNSAIQQGSAGATQTANLSAEQTTGVEQLLEAIAKLMPDLPQSEPETHALRADIETIKAQSKSPLPKRAVVKECLKGVRSSLESVAGKALAAGAGMAATEMAGKIGELIAAWGG